MSGGEVDADPPSPCVDVCVIDADGKFCVGCRRSLDEIAAWPTLPADQKRALLQALKER